MDESTEQRVAVDGTPMMNGEQVDEQGLTTTGYFSGDGGASSRRPQVGDKFYWGRPPNPTAESKPKSKSKSKPKSKPKYSLEDYVTRKVLYEGAEWWVVEYDDEMRIYRLQHAQRDASVRLDAATVEALPWAESVPKPALGASDDLYKRLRDAQTAWMQCLCQYCVSARKVDDGDPELVWQMQGKCERYAAVSKVRDAVRAHEKKQVTAPIPDGTPVIYDGEEWFVQDRDLLGDTYDLRHKSDQIREMLNVKREDIIPLFGSECAELGNQPAAELPARSTDTPEPMFTPLRIGQRVMYRMPGKANTAWKVLRNNGNWKYDLQRWNDPSFVAVAVPRSDITTFADDDDYLPAISVETPRARTESSGAADAEKQGAQVGREEADPREGAPRDSIHHPSHYVYSKHELIDVIEAWGCNFNTGNVLKYICRADRKGDLLENLKKARFYLSREIFLVAKMEEEGRGCGEEPPIACGTFTNPQAVSEAAARARAKRNDTVDESSFVRKASQQAAEQAEMKMATRLPLQPGECIDDVMLPYEYSGRVEAYEARLKDVVQKRVAGLITSAEALEELEEVEPDMVRAPRSRAELAEFYMDRASAKNRRDAYSAELAKRVTKIENDSARIGSSVADLNGKFKCY